MYLLLEVYILYYSRIVRLHPRKNGGIEQYQARRFLAPRRHRNNRMDAVPTRTGLYPVVFERRRQRGTDGPLTQDNARQRHSRQRFHVVQLLGKSFLSNQQEDRSTSVLHSPDTRGAGLLRVIPASELWHTPGPLLRGGLAWSGQ